MGKFVWLVAAVTALSASQSFAQAKRFEGLTLGLNAEAVRSTTEQVMAGVSASDTGNTTDADIQLQYAWALTPQFALGVGATVGTGTLKAGTINGTEFTLRDRYSVDIIPGFALSDSTLAYAKITYLTANAKAQGAGIDTSNGVNGYGLGVGFRALMEKNLYLQAAYDFNKYDEKTTAVGASLKPNSNIFSIGVGYRF